MRLSLYYGGAGNIRIRDIRGPGWEDAGNMQGCVRCQPTICSGTDYAKLSLLTGLRELRLDFSSLDYDDYDGDGVYEAFAFVAD